MTTAFTLRAARDSDVKAIARVHVRSRREAMPWLPDIHSRAETEWWIENVVLPQQQVWIAESENEIVGIAAVSGDMLEQLYILPGHQGRGIGSALLTWAISSSDSPLRLRVFQRNEPARAFYERRGFAVIEYSDGSGNEEKEADVLYRLCDRAWISLDWRDVLPSACSHSAWKSVRNCSITAWRCSASSWPFLVFIRSLSSNNFS